MKIGDLVKYARDLQGLQGIFGYIVGFNGEAITVRWFNNYDETTTELPELIEVINGA